MVLRQEEARFPRVPTLHATLGVQGGRPRGGTWENKALVSCVAGRNRVTGQRTTRLLEQPARRQAKTGDSTQPRRQAACVAPLRAIARAYPAHAFPAVVITI